MEKQIAFLIDAENMGNALNPADQIASIIKDVVYVQRKGNILTQIAFANWGNYYLRNTDAKNTYLKHGILPRQCDTVTMKKNASDIALVIEAMDLLHASSVKPDIYYTKKLINLCHKTTIWMSKKSHNHFGCLL